ncbi:MAG: DNA mismatch repair endonuclease MutL [SAR202 cluster bacterium]|nr:DNA mismatch repair endonuclease MutL [SAR202 cluster bacterium]
MKIKVLDPLIASKIAAGEVIERPSSVIKELVENSIDANSTTIEIEIINGGMDLIKIIDNGEGITKEDLPLAIKRHATSKIDTIDDLSYLISMGFRGEALASIAAVSQMELSSKPLESPAGSNIQVENSTILNEKPVSMINGTSIIVNNLFYNLPARKKFMSTQKSESNRILRLVNHFCVTYPEIRFKLIIDEKQKINTIGNGELIYTIAKILSQNLANELIPVDFTDNDFKISGYISPPHISRTNRSNILYSVNKRIVKDKLITMALEQAYRGFLTVGRFPITVLDLSTNPSKVDINVHPRKDEVRFMNENEVFSFIQRSVRETLVEKHPVPNTFNSTYDTSYPLNSSTTKNLFTQKPTDYNQIDPIEQKFFDFDKNNGQNTLQNTNFPILRAIGQIDNTYIIAEGENGMYILDQHACHEKINYEKIIESIGSNMMDMQLLMEPYLIDISTLKTKFLTKKLESLNANGVSIDQLDDQTIMLKGVPATISNTKLNEFIKDIESFIESELDIDDALGTMSAIAASIACHSSIRAGDTIDINEMNLLLRGLENCIEPFHCPHGRPTIQNINIQQLNRMFIRPN